MAEDSSSFMDTLKQKVGPLPMGAWVALLAVVGGYMWYRHKQTAAASAQAAADQTNSSLGTAGNLANQFDVAGLMPYSGGDTYINSVGTGNIGVGNPAVKSPSTIAVTPGQDVGSLINQIRKTINPNFTWADFWALNPGIAKNLKQDPKTKIWKFLKNETIVISKPGFGDVPAGTTTGVKK